MNAPSVRGGLSRRGSFALRGAALVGLVHAGTSLYWALGGRWLLDTVGQWAVDLVQAHPVAGGVGLLAVAIAKAAGALLPLLATLGRVRAPRLWRALAWPGSILLIVYGGVNTLVSGLVLTGVLVPDGGYDRAAMIGHAFLWDPLFLIWGVLLLCGLLWTRRAIRGRR